MSSTERAPEPTMEDILASIRRIITDDEAGSAQAGTPAATSPAEDEGLQGEADNQIIDDIARVLSSGGEEPADQDEEIMDLTSELGGLELVEDDVVEEVVETLEVVETVETVETLEIAEATPEFVEAADEADELFELDEVQPDILEPDVLEADAEALEIETVEMADEAEMPPLPAEAAYPAEMPPLVDTPPPAEMPPLVDAVPEPLAEPEPVAAADEPKPSASEEAATALERAIAALKAGQSPSIAPAPLATAPVAAPIEAADTPTGVMPMPEEMPMAVPMEPVTPEDMTHLDPEAESVLEFEPETAEEDVAELALEESDLVLTDADTEETGASEEAQAEDAPFWPQEADAEQAAELEPEVAAEPEPSPVFAPPIPDVAAGVLASQASVAVSQEPVAGKSLEDSIKEMLRPMLREWLDENMPRIIREEVDAEALRSGQD